MFPRSSRNTNGTDLWPNEPGPMTSHHHPNKTIIIKFVKKLPLFLTRSSTFGENSPKIPFFLGGVPQHGDDDVDSQMS